MAERAETLAVAVIANRSPARAVTGHRPRQRWPVRKRREGRAGGDAGGGGEGLLQVEGQAGEGGALARTPGWAAQDARGAADVALEVPGRKGARSLRILG